VVHSNPDARSLETHILGDREHAVVALAPALTGEESVFAPKAIREIVGPHTRIYLIRGDLVLRRLQGALGRKLAPVRGAARIWWPDLSVDSDPDDHPLVQRIQDDSELIALQEFARCFDLSRPFVRHEIKRIEREREEAMARERDMEKQLRMFSSRGERR